jgi:opacity protein-like surface antigen
MFHNERAQCRRTNQKAWSNLEGTFDALNEEPIPNRSMKTSHIVLTGVLVLGTLQPGISAAQSRPLITPHAGPYFHADLGGSIPAGGALTDASGYAAAGKVSYDAGLSLGVAAGYQFNPYLAVEVQSGWNVNQIDSIPGFSVSDTYFSSVPILVNGIFQWPIPRTRLVPFIGAGVGGAATIFDTDHMVNNTVALVGADSDFVFAWQAFAGLRFNISEQFSAGVAYKYYSTDDSEYRYVPVYYGPDLRLGFEGLQLHQIVLTCTLKF